MTPIDSSFPQLPQLDSRLREGPVRPRTKGFAREDGVRSEKTANRGKPVNREPAPGPDPIRQENQRSAAKPPPAALLRFAPPAPGPFVPFVAQSLAQEVFLVGRVSAPSERAEFVGRYRDAQQRLQDGDRRGSLVDFSA